MSRHAIATMAVLLLAACTAGKQDELTATTAPPAALPSPEGAPGSITGMPAPGTPTPSPVAELPAATLPDAMPAGEAHDVQDAQAGRIPPTGGGLPPLPAPVDGPGAEEAVAVLRDYYAAINIRDYAAAWRLWRAEHLRQTPEQFAAGFADAAGVSVQLGPPGPVDAGAGQRHIEIPASVSVTRPDGNVQRYRGVYALQRTIVDSASDEQRQWRIVRGDLRPE